MFWDAPLNHPEEVRRSTPPISADRMRGQDGRGPAGGLIPRSVDGGLLRRPAVHGLPGHQPAAAGGHRQDGRALGRLHLPGRAEGFLLGLAPAVALARRSRPSPRRSEVSGGEAGKPNVLRARNRLAVAGGKDGSVAVFPPPHQFFFARELEVNLGYVWHRRDAEKTFSLGVRQGENAEGYNPVWIEKVFSLYNAPPGT